MKFITFFLFLTNLLYSQIHNGKVTYKVVVTENKEISNKNPIAKDFYIDAIENSKKIEFNLVFDSINSFFNKVEKLDIDDKKDLFSIKLTQYNGAINQKNKKKYIIEKEYFNGINYVENPIKTNWVFLNETKTIGDYECYKAKLMYKDGIYNAINKEREVTAWYCPQIPFSYGPLGFGGLPGVILELHYAEVVYGASKLEINNKDLQIPTFDTKKTISPEEYKKIIEKFKQ